MRYQPVGVFRERNIISMRSFMIFLLCCTSINSDLGFSSTLSSLRALPLNGHFSFAENQDTARDFGNRFQFLPQAVLHPKSVSDIADTIRHIWQMGPGSELTVAARGHGHSLQGQSQAHWGVVIKMESLSGPKMQVYTGKHPYIDVSGGELWINILQESLFHGVLGGLGQFGIITRARISLLDNSNAFLTGEMDKSSLLRLLHIYQRPGAFDIFKPQDPVQASQFQSDGRTLFCLELAKNFNPEKIDMTNKEIENLLSQLSYISSTLLVSEVSYIEFLDRVHVSEVKLRSKGLWDVPHPWLNLLVPRSKIHTFAEVVFGNILTDTNNGPILIYPVNKSKWDNRTSPVLPDEEIFYLVAFLSSAVPSSTGTDGLEHILTQNKRILDFCDAAHLGIKQYLAHYKTQEEWRAHFGPKWGVFVQRKSAYDPLALLAPGHKIFQKSISIL